MTTNLYAKCTVRAVNGASTAQIFQFTKHLRQALNKYSFTVILFSQSLSPSLCRFSLCLFVFVSFSLSLSMFILSLSRAITFCFSTLHFQLYLYIHIQTFTNTPAHIEIIHSYTGYLPFFVNRILLKNEVLQRKKTDDDDEIHIIKMWRKKI